MKKKTVSNEDINVLEEVESVDIGIDELDNIVADDEELSAAAKEELQKSYNLEEEMERTEKKLRKGKKEIDDVLEDVTEKNKEKKHLNALEEAMNNSIKGMKLSKRAFRNQPIDMSTGYIRHLVTSYYTLQGDRIKISNQSGAIERSQEEGEEKNIIMQYFTEQLKQTEENVQVFLDVWTDRHPVGKWLKSITGIGPVIAAGLIARFDVRKTQTAGGFWSYIGWCEGGLNRKSRKRGEKIDYSPESRTLVWKAGSSFRMQSTRANCYYGKLYLEKKAQYIEKNNAGGFAENAANELKMKKFDKSTVTFKAYSEGKLPDAHIDAMAIRYSAKMFLSHLFDVMYMYEYGEMPPVPYSIIYVDGHAHLLPPDNIELMIPALNEKYPDKDWRKIIADHYKKPVEIVKKSK